MSNTPMTSSNSTATETDQRLTNLEIKATYMDDLVDQLEQIIVRQQQQVDALLRSVAELRLPSTDGGLGPARSLQDDLPPHF